MAGKKDLLILQGTTFTFSFNLTQIADGVESAVDLSNCIAKMQIRPTHRSEELYLDLGAEGYISVTDPVNGEVTIDIPATATAELDFSSAVYDVEVVFDNGHVMRLVEGKINLSPEVTR